MSVNRITVDGRLKNATPEIEWENFVLVRNAPFFTCPKPLMVVLTRKEEAEASMRRGMPLSKKSLVASAMNMAAEAENNLRVVLSKHPEIGVFKLLKRFALQTTSSASTEAPLGNRFLPKPSHECV